MLFPRSAMRCRPLPGELKSDQDDELSIPDQISAPQTARLAYQAIEPFHTDPLRPARSSLAQAGGGIERGANPDRGADRQRQAIFPHPYFLLRHPQCNAEEIGRSFSDQAAHHRRLRGLVLEADLRTVAADYAQTGITPY